MAKLTSYIFVGLTLTASLFSSCSEKKSKDGRTDTNSSGAINFVSDESFSPIIEEEREVFEFDHPQAKLTAIYTNESEAINKVLSGEEWLAFTSRDWKPNEKESLEAKRFRPTSIKLGFDALAFIVNKNNNDSLLSVQDVEAIMNGEITTWEKLHDGKHRGTITIVFDNPKSSTVHFVEDSILGGKPIKNPNATAVDKTADVIKYVEDNPNAIGIIGNNWLNDKRDTTNLTFNRNIRVVSASKIHPATEASSRKPYQGYIFNGEYPFVRTIYALVNDPRHGLPWSFANFISLPKGQLIIFKAGLLPYRGDIVIRDVNVTD